MVTVRPRPGAGGRTSGDRMSAAHDRLERMVDRRSTDDVWEDLMSCVGALETVLSITDEYWDKATASHTGDLRQLAWAAVAGRVRHAISDALGVDK